jgi:3-oxoacyl-[acyl-carrier-protein] synthase-3
VDRFGNCGAAGAPGVLSQNWERFSPGDLLAMVVVGAGLSWGGALITFDGEPG